MDIPYTEHMMCDLTINDTIVTNSVIYVLKNILKRKKSEIEYEILRTNILVSVPNSHTFKVWYTTTWTEGYSWSPSLGDILKDILSSRKLCVGDHRFLTMVRLVNLFTIYLYMHRAHCVYYVSAGITAIDRPRALMTHRLRPWDHLNNIRRLQTWMLLYKSCLLSKRYRQDE